LPLDESITITFNFPPGFDYGSASQEIGISLDATTLCGNPTSISIENYPPYVPGTLNVPVSSDITSSDCLDDVDLETGAISITNVDNSYDYIWLDGDEWDAPNSFVNPIEGLASGTYTLQISDPVTACIQIVELEASLNDCEYTPPPAEDCHLVWDGIYSNEIFSTGSAIIAEMDDYTVFGSAQLASNDLDYFYFRNDQANDLVFQKTFGDVDSEYESRDEVIKDAVSYGGYVYTVGTGWYRYATPPAMKHSIMVSKFNESTGALVDQRRIRFSSSSDDFANGIDVIRLPGTSEYRIVIGGHTDSYNTSSPGRFDMFSMLLSPNLDVLTSKIYDYAGRIDYCNSLITLRNQDAVILVGQSNGRSSAIRVNSVSLDLEEEIILNSVPSELHAVVERMNELYFLGEVTASSAPGDMLLFSSGSGLTDGLTDVMLWSDLDNPGHSLYGRDLLIHTGRLFFVGFHGNSYSETFEGMIGEIDFASLSEDWVETIDNTDKLFALDGFLESGTYTPKLIAVGEGVNPNNNQGIAVVKSNLNGPLCCNERMFISKNILADRPLVNGFIDMAQAVTEPKVMNVDEDVYLSENLCVTIPGGVIPRSDIENTNSFESPEVLVFPNPNNGFFELKVNENSAMERVMITDLSGKVVADY
ncbi:MAG: T9SS type A sorting domain-containing protein, partial [Flavobacteriales bacterium]|nr:T9SS type A sorting domain-containing protein [Flavobacteriales bacterium]